MVGQTGVNSYVNKAADDAAGGNEQHRDHRHQCVLRSNAKCGMKNNREGSNHAANHVENEPRLGRAYPLERLHTFFERVHKQQQHEDSAHHAEVIAKI